MVAANVEAEGCEGETKLLQKWDQYHVQEDLYSFGCCSPSVFCFGSLWLK